jgi:protein-disulfide isomerase-like protein with CxxC motif
MESDKRVCECCGQAIPDEPRVRVQLVYDAAIVAEAILTAKQWDDNRNAFLTPNDWLAERLGIKPTSRFEVRAWQG